MTARPSLQEREFIEKTKPYSYLLFKKHGYYFAINGEYGELEFFDEYADVVLNKCMSKLTNGGIILFKPATYVFNNPVDVVDKVSLEGLGAGSPDGGAVVFQPATNRSFDSFIRAYGHKTIQVKNIVFDCKGQVESAVKCLAPNVEGLFFSTLQDLTVFRNTGYAFILENPMMCRLTQLNIQTKTGGYGGSLKILQSHPEIHNGDSTIYYLKHEGPVTSDKVDSAVHIEATNTVFNFLDGYIMLDVPQLGEGYNAMLLWGNGGRVEYCSFKVVIGVPANAGAIYCKGDVYAIVIEDLRSFGTGHTITFEPTVEGCQLILRRPLSLKVRDLSQGRNHVDEWNPGMIGPAQNEIPQFSVVTTYPILERTVNYGTVTHVGNMALYGAHVATQLYVYVRANNLNGSCDVIVQKNEVDTAKKITIPAATTGRFIEKSTPVEYNSVSQADERVNVRIVASGTGGSIVLSGMLILATRKLREMF